MTRSTSEIINDLEVQAWALFEMEYRPQAICDFEIFDEKREEHFNPSTNSWSEKSTKERIIKYEGKEVFISTHLFMENGDGEKMFFFDSIFDGECLKWTLRNCIYEFTERVDGVHKRHFMLFRHNEDMNSLEITDIDGFYAFKEAGDAAKCSLIIGKSFYNEDRHTSEQLRDVLACVIDAENATYKVSPFSKTDLNRDIILDYFNTDQDQYDTETMKKVMYMMKGQALPNEKGLFSRNKHNEGAGILYAFNLRNTFRELLDMTPVTPAWIDPNGDDEEEIFGISSTIMAHAGHREFMDGLAQMERLSRISKLHKDIDNSMFYHLFKFLDEDSEGNESYDPIPMLDEIIINMEAGSNIQDALELIRIKEAA